MAWEGTAFLDRSGRVLAADEEFRRLLGLGAGDVTALLRARIRATPSLAALIDGRDAQRLRLDGVDGAPPCEIGAVASESGTLLRVASAPTLLALELAMQSVVLTRLAASLAHEIKNPLNAMALQLAVLGEKVASASTSLAAACSSNMSSLQNQIGRINEVVRRYLDVTDPSASPGCDAGQLLADALCLFGHEARRRRLTLSCEAAPCTLRAAADPVRVARCLLGLLWCAVSSAREDGQLEAKAFSRGREVALSIGHARGSADPALGWMERVVEEAVPGMGGRLERAAEGETIRATIILPKEGAL